MNGTEVVRAAGGAVWRRRLDGGLEVLLVHRPRYDDWSLPKGKLDGDEDEATAALREVLEETGLECRFGPELTTVAYRDNKGRPKSVRYWAMTVGRDHGRDPDHEVDERRWVPLEEAAAMLSYEHDRAVLERLAVHVG